MLEHYTVKGEGCKSQLSIMLYYYITLMQHVTAYVQKAIIRKN